MLGCTARPLRQGDRMTEVVIIGTIHGQHLESPLYKPEVLRQIVLSLKPDAVLHESPLSQWDTVAGRPTFRTYGDAEGWAGDQAAQQLGIPQIPFDRADRQEHFRETRYFDRERRCEGALKEVLRNIKALDANGPADRIVELFLKLVQAQADLNRAGTARDMNCRSFDEMIRSKHTLGRIIAEMLFANAAHATALEDRRFLDADWQERNEIMAGNILQAARGRPGKRLVVLTGSEHRYILRDLLAGHGEVQLREFWELVDVHPADVLASPDRAVWEQNVHGQKKGVSSGPASQPR
jgi:hypothetical protein